MAQNMGRAFDRDQCVFYDPSVHLGGPNPIRSEHGRVKAINVNARNPWRNRITRVRRSAHDEDDYDEYDYEITEEDISAMDSCDGTETDQQTKDFCSPTSATMMRVCSKSHLGLF